MKTKYIILKQIKIVQNSTSNPLQKQPTLDKLKYLQYNFLSFLVLTFLIFVLIGCSASGGTKSDDTSDSGKSASAEGSTELFDQVDKLIKEKKYNSAYKLLDKNDPDNDNPDIFIKKVDIMLKYYVSTINHKLFGLADLGENDTLEKLRGKTDKYDLYDIDIDKILTDMIKKYRDKNQQIQEQMKQNPEQKEELAKDIYNTGKLYLALGNYYYDVREIYGNKWDIGEQHLLTLIEDNYFMAFQLGYYDYKSMFGLGFIQLVVKKNYENAIFYFEKSFELNPSFGDAVYNLAYTYYVQENYDKALEYSLKASEVYKKDELKAKSLKIAGKIYFDELKILKAMECYEKAKSYLPNDYSILKHLLDVYLLDENLEKIREYAKQLFMLDPYDPYILGNVLGSFIQYGFKNEWKTFIEKMTEKFADNYEVLGNIFLHKGMFFAYEKDKLTARTNFLKAKEYYGKIFEPSHPVFARIDEHLDILKRI